ncbi:hypothetical protein [Lewinella cohaerens]|uniref:hypothetical protein n=1 Tax=Lewinella cohaerens TaxID=70995 RepID=UPI00037681E2|nr:hypothetical protein [Lewinella cohaerens]
MRLNDQNYILDAELLPMIAKAENGDLEAQLILAEAFGEGKNASESPNMAAYFEQMIFNSTEDTLVKFSILWNLAIRAKQQQDYSLMKLRFHDAIDFMQENIPMEEWDFSLFGLMEDFLLQE